MTVLRFPAEIAVGEVFWAGGQVPGGWGHRLAIGDIEVPDGTAVELSVIVVAEVGVRVGDEERVTWKRGMPDSALRNTRDIWGGPEGRSFYIRHGEEAVDLGFLRGLPPGSVFDLSVTGKVLVESFAAVAHLAPGLRRLGVYLDDLGPDAPAVIAGLTALESLVLAGEEEAAEGQSRLDDHALSMIAALPALERLTLLDGGYTEHGLRQLRRLPKLRHLHIEREGLTAPMFEFAAAMPALTRLSGLDEFGDDGPMPPAEVARVQAMLTHVIVR